MVMEILGWILLFGGSLAYLVAWIFPASRPYAKKFTWVATLVGLTGIALVVLRRRGGSDDVEDAAVEGEAIQNDTIGTIDGIINVAKANMASADAELARTRLRSTEDKFAFQSKLSVAEGIGDSVARRKALLDLVASV